MFSKQSLYVVGIIYVVALIAMFALQRKILYRPPDHAYMTPQEAHASSVFEELVVTTEDGLNLKGWYAPATTQPLTIVYFHGNGDSLRTVAPIAMLYVSLGYGFLISEYRGYSGMPGTPSETGLYTDARAYLAKLLSLNIPDKNIVLMGYSLGSGVAVQMATEHQPAGLILLAPYLSIPKVAQAKFPIFPVQYLTLDRFDNFKKIANVHTPLLVTNGGQDRVIPHSQGSDLFGLANEPKQFYFSPTGTHINLFDSEFYPISLKWLKALSVSIH